MNLISLLEELAVPVVVGFVFVGIVLLLVISIIVVVIW